ncbi:MAG TPA: C39 family peptidase [Planctomycetota bacterium]|nr:C39 family peptidase [Planctomycetota bacterium]
MGHQLDFRIQPQPDDISCGPTCLQAVYSFYGDPIPLSQVMLGIPMLTNRGTLAVVLGNHALRRGYRATLYTYNLQVFDPTWFQSPPVVLGQKLLEQRAAKDDDRLRESTDHYVEFLHLGGRILMEDLTPALLRRHLKRGHPLITGLSATWLYRVMREMPHNEQDDDVRGSPLGHFVVIYGYDPEERAVWLADPHKSNPIDNSLHYRIDIDRAVTAILLGVITYDADFLVIEPHPKTRREADSCR